MPSFASRTAEPSFSSASSSPLISSSSPLVSKPFEIPIEMSERTSSVEIEILSAAVHNRPTKSTDSRGGLMFRCRLRCFPFHISLNLSLFLCILNFLHCPTLFLHELHLHQRTDRPSTLAASGGGLSLFFPFF